MKTKWIRKQFKYDGTQLRPLFAYENYRVLGDSIVSWIGPCNISFKEMVDLEDVLARSSIRGDLMLHFILEIFQESLFSAVCLQRLFASVVMEELNKQNRNIYRRGDDLYLNDKKLSISIASKSSVSAQIHFAMNITNQGTPVKTLSLQELKQDPEMLSKKIMTAFNSEYLSIVEATQKVRPL